MLKVRFTLFLFILAAAFCGTVRGQSWDFYTVRENETSLTDTFSLSQQPYSYLFIPHASYEYLPSSLNVKWTWVFSGEDRYEERYFLLPWETHQDAQGNFYIFETAPLWEDIKEPGQWEAQISWCAWEGGGYHNKSASFTVTPEPLGCSLFALGGAAIAFIKKRRRI